MATRDPVTQRRRSAQRLARKLRESADAINDFIEKCHACADGSAPKALDDQRYLMRQELNDYRAWLELRYGATTDDT